MPIGFEESLQALFHGVGRSESILMNVVNCERLQAIFYAGACLWVVLMNEKGG